MITTVQLVDTHVHTHPLRPCLIFLQVLLVEPSHAVVREYQPILAALIEKAEQEKSSSEEEEEDGEEEEDDDDDDGEDDDHDDDDTEGGEGKDGDEDVDALQARIASLSAVDHRAQEGKSK